MLKELIAKYGNINYNQMGIKDLNELRDGLKNVEADEVNSATDGRAFIDLVKKLRLSIAETDKLHGDNYPKLLESLLAVGEDGLYNDSLRFIFELIQNVDDCEYPDDKDCALDIFFDFNNDLIRLSYNEVGFSPFNVFAITGIAEKAKNVSDKKKEIGEKGIGFKSVFGVADRVRIRSGFFSFDLNKNNFTIPEPQYDKYSGSKGTEMTLFVERGKAREIYNKIRDKYCNQDALFASNPILFLNKLTRLRMYYDSWRSMEFCVERVSIPDDYKTFIKDASVKISVDLNDSSNGVEKHECQTITCTRYTYPVCYTREACKSRYGADTALGEAGGRELFLQVAFPHREYVEKVGNGELYSFLPTQLHLTVPVVCHVPFKLDASREFVDPQGNNKWFEESVSALSQLLDYAYTDFSRDIGADIVFYLPGERYSLFANSGNDKEKCLNSRKELQGGHFVQLPIFVSQKGNYCNAADVYIFNPDEGIREQDKVASLLGLTRELFIPPVDAPVKRLFLETRKNICEELYKRMFLYPDYTKPILQYMYEHAGDYAYFKLTEGLLPERVILTVGQIEALFEYKEIKDFIGEISNRYVGEYKKLTFTLEKNVGVCDITDVMYEGFECSEAPKKVERYLANCRQKVALANIAENQFFACDNGLVLSSKNPIASFVAFCGAIDSHDIFAVRMKLRNASEKLDAYGMEEDISADEYLHELRNIRYTVKDSLGKQGYKSYLDLILKSGIDSKRFIQELLQNADDCRYPENVTPEFEFRIEKRRLIAEYNESGFTKANVRSITAIGESTKNKLLSGEVQSIGEKGVGFKTVFAVASSVIIHSGDFNFRLTDQEPTIPKNVDPLPQKITGTRLVLELKPNQEIPSYNIKNVLELCLCLRQLKRLKIDNHTVEIVDKEKKRIITIDGKQQYVFDVVCNEFEITDEEAFEERTNGIQSVARTQRVTCYIPRKGAESYEWNLYSGLPTKHKIKIPLAIDAPFALTTSREEIDISSEKWNTLIRKELYKNLLNVVETFKKTERIDILRFCRFVPRQMGNKRIYVNDIFDFDFLRAYDFLADLRNTEILPTYDESRFISPVSKSAKRYPLFMKYLFDDRCFGEISPASIIDEKVKENNKDKAKEAEYEPALNALECEPAAESYVYSIIDSYIEEYIGDKEFRDEVYDFLSLMKTDFSAKTKMRRIIPVYDLHTSATIYISWKQDMIYVKNDAKRSSQSYFVLNDSILPKSVCEKILHVNINEMNEEWEKSRYHTELRKKLDDSSISEEDKYGYIISELDEGRLEHFKARSVLLEFAKQERLPMMNQMGEIVYYPLFISHEDEDYFPVDVIRSVTVSEDGKKLAEFLDNDLLQDAYYDDFDYKEQLTADDVECLYDDYFLNREEILRGFYLDGLLSDELVRDYQLEYLTMVGPLDEDEDYEFPSYPVANREQLKSHIRSMMKNPIRIVTVKVERQVKKGKNSKGDVFDLDFYDSREGAIKTYMPVGTNGKCFCQMCNRVKPIQFIEVNNLEREPDYYYPQMRISLCLECSKRFEAIRNNENLRKGYLKEIIETEIRNEGIVEIPLNSQSCLTFTGTHLAEIQTILTEQGKK